MSETCSNVFSALSNETSMTRFTPGGPPCCSGLPFRIYIISRGHDPRLGPWAEPTNRFPSWKRRTADSAIFCKAARFACSPRGRRRAGGTLHGGKGGRPDPPLVLSKIRAGDPRPLTQCPRKSYTFRRIGPSPHPDRPCRRKYAPESGVEFPGAPAFPSRIPSRIRGTNRLISTP